MRMLVVAALVLLQGPGGLRVASGVISGQIQSGERPAAGVRISALQAADSAGGISGAGGAMLASLAETDSAGRFRLEQLPPGRYYIMAGALDYPSYYPGVKTQAEARVITVTVGATISGIDFVLARPASLRVSGRVQGVPATAPAGLVRVSLIPQAGGVGSASLLETPVQPDGTFEFPKVGPGRYTARLTVATTNATTTVIQIDDKDFRLDMNLGANSLRFGRVVLEDGGKLPVQMAAVASGQPDPPALVRFQARRTAAPVAGRGSVQQIAIQVRSDGFFSLPPAAGAGEYQILPMQMPLGYYMKSVAVEPGTSQIQITLTTTPPASEPRGVKVSGRVSGIATAGQAPRWISLQTSMPNPSLGLTEQRIGEAPIRDDGTFEFLNVPRGSAILNVVAAPGTPVSGQFQMRLDITNRDVFVEFAVSSSEPAPGSSAAPSASAPAAPFTIVLPDESGALPPLTPVQPIPFGTPLTPIPIP